MISSYRKLEALLEASEQVREMLQHDNLAMALELAKLNDNWGRANSYVVNWRVCTCPACVAVRRVQGLKRKSDRLTKRCA